MNAPMKYFHGPVIMEDDPLPALIFCASGPGAMGILYPSLYSDRGITVDDTAIKSDEKNNS